MFGCRFTKFWLFGIVAAMSPACILFQGCVPHQVNSSPFPALNEAACIASFSNDTLPAESALPCPWWDSFHDEDLSCLVTTALEQNPDVRSISRRIEQANARIVQAGASLFPLLDGESEAQRSWDVDGDYTDEASFGLNLNWEIDLWGRIRSGRKARINEAEATVQDWMSARLILSAAVAETWFAIAEQRGQLALAREQIEVNQTLLDMTELRFGQGQNTVVGVYQQQAQLEAILALVPDIESRIEELELVLDALAGQVPGKKNRKKERSDSYALLSPPPIPDAGVPADLLCRRPDLRAQRARIVALDYEVGEAVADRMPRFSIGGSITAASAVPGIESLVGDAIANAVGPIIDAGDRKAEVRFRRARVKEEIDVYTAVFLDAAREVETALIRERKIAERIQLQKKQLETTRKLLRESRNQYSQGATDYLPVLDAVARLQSLERDFLFSQRELLSARVVLHRALGGTMPDSSVKPH